MMTRLINCPACYSAESVHLRDIPANAGKSVRCCKQCFTVFVMDDALGAYLADTQKLGWVCSRLQSMELQSGVSL